MSSTFIQPYLFFGGRCQEALDFYSATIGAKIDMVMQFKDSPDPVPADSIPPGFETKVMHSAFRVGNTVIMASDGCTEDAGFKGFSLSLSLPTEADTDRVFELLAKDGSVQMPLGKTFWSPRFGVLTDKFGIGWMVTVADPRAK